MRVKAKKELRSVFDIDEKYVSMIKEALFLFFDFIFYYLIQLKSFNPRSLLIPRQPLDVNILRTLDSFPNSTYYNPRANHFYSNNKYLKLL